MKNESISKTPARNSIYSIIANGWYLLSRFLLTPFILHYLSISEYGLWSLCFIVMSFLALTSMGIEGAYVKYVAEFHASGRIDKANRLISTGLILTTFFALFFMICLWQAMPFLLDILKIEQSLRDTASVIFLTTGLIFTLDISLNCFGRALDGIQKIALTSKVRLIATFVELFFIVLFLLAGYGIYGLLLAFFIRYLLTIIINMGYAFKLVPGLRVHLRYFDRDSLKLLFFYGGKMQILGFIGIFMSTFDRLVITRLLGLASTGMYEIGRKLPFTGASIPAVISGAMMPALSHLQGKNDMVRARKLFMDASRYMAMIAAVLFSYLFIVSPYALYMWLGTGYEAASMVMYVISTGVLINLLTGPSSAAAKGFARLDWELKYAIVNMVLCLVATPLLTLWIGLIGAAWGVAGSTAVASIYFIGTTNRFFQIEITEYFKTIGQPVLIAVLSAMGFFLLLPELITIGSTSRVTTGLILAGVGGAHLLGSGLLLFFSRGLTKMERAWLKRILADQFGLCRRRLS